MVRLLLNHDAVVNRKDIQGRDPFHLASAGGRMKIVEILSRFGVDLTIIDMQGPDCLHHAASNDSIEIVNWLLKEGFDPFLDSQSPPNLPKEHFTARRYLEREQ